MDCFILTESEFFRQINNDSPCCGLKAAYDAFVVQVMELCGRTEDLHLAFFAITYAEIELQYHQAAVASCDTENELSVHIRKALAFLRKMVKHVASNPVAPASNRDTAVMPKSCGLQWTGNAIDLVEMIYGINELGCINNGETPLKELAPILYSFFGVESKDCYRFYTDIKRRKNESRTYFLDKMQEKLNERMRRDEEAERLRR
jgi:hypothetical protein